MAMKRVAEDPLAREAGHELADHAHGGQDHDVDRGVRVEPEEVLEEDRDRRRGSGSKKPKWKARSRATSRMVTAMTGVPRIWMRLVA